MPCTALGTDWRSPPLSPQEDNEFRVCSINLFGMLLRGVKEEHRNRVEDIVVRSLVPLIIQLTDPVSGEVS